MLGLSDRINDSDSDQWNKHNSEDIVGIFSGIHQPSLISWYRSNRHFYISTQFNNILIPYFAGLNIVCVFKDILMVWVESTCLKCVFLFLQLYFFTFLIVYKAQWLNAY